VKTKLSWKTIICHLIQTLLDILNTIFSFKKNEWKKVNKRNVQEKEWK